MSADGSAPAPEDLHLDHGDVAFVDGNGVALAMSTERDTVVQISYPDQVSWLTVAERFRSWIIAGLWLFATAALLSDTAAHIPPPALRLSRARVRPCRCRRPTARLAIFWSAGASSPCPQLDEAVGLAERWNVRLGDALLSRNWVDPRLYYETYAQNFDLPFVDLMREPPDRELLHASDAELYANRLTMPWRRSDGRLLIATAEPGPGNAFFSPAADGAPTSNSSSSPSSTSSLRSRPPLPTLCRTEPCSNSPSSIRKCPPVRSSHRCR